MKDGNQVKYRLEMAPAVIFEGSQRNPQSPNQTDMNDLEPGN